MRKTLLFIKVFLLLAAFVGTSGSHAAKAGNHNLLASPPCDFNVHVGNQSVTDDDKAVVTEFSFDSHQSFTSPANHWYLSIIAQDFIGKPFARAPPVSLSA